MKIHITNIEWDTSDFSEEEELASGICVPDLPREVTISVDPMSIVDYDVEDLIVEALTDMYEYPVAGFNYEIL